MRERKRVFVIPAQLTVVAFDEKDAIKEASNAIADGLIEPGFCLDGAVSEEQQLMELEPIGE